jgi:uncharacterized membrane protein YphA (DoxX/SURF4 family)
MFPTGMAGAALIVLRVSVAAALLLDGTAHQTPATSFWTLAALLLLALLLVVGFLTPYASAGICLVELGIALLGGEQHNVHLFLSALNSGVVAILGPGAYSIDAHIFGRRLVIVPPRR